MAWNRPENNSTKNRSAGSVRSLRVPWFRRIVVPAIVFLCGCFLLWWMFGRSESKLHEETPVKSHPSKIAEATPHISTNRVSPENEKKDEHVVIGSRGLPINTHGRKLVKDENGVWRFESGQRVFDPNRPLEKLEIKPQGAPPIFEHSSENDIAAIIELTPGDMIIEGEYGEDFIADFRKSLEKEIKATEEDSDYVKDIKTAVIEVKKDLLARLNRGEDIAKYLTETRNDLHNLHQYREELRKQVVDLLDDGESVADSDVPDLIGAANTMLREKGIKELEDNEFVRQALILERKEMEKDAERSENE